MYLKIKFNFTKLYFNNSILVQLHCSVDSVSCEMIHFSFMLFVFFLFCSPSFFPNQHINIILHHRGTFRVH